jgi:hypothetical protein
MQFCASQSELILFFFCVFFFFLFFFFFAGIFARSGPRSCCCCFFSSRVYFASHCSGECCGDGLARRTGYFAAGAENTACAGVFLCVGRGGDAGRGASRGPGRGAGGAARGAGQRADRLQGPVLSVARRRRAAGKCRAHPDRARSRTHAVVAVKNKAKTQKERRFLKTCFFSAVFLGVAVLLLWRVLGPLF